MTLAARIIQNPVTPLQPVVVKPSPPPSPYRVARFERSHETTKCIEAAVELAGVSWSDMFGKSRHWLVVLAREGGIWAARELAKASYPDIAAAMGERNHSMVITAHQRAKRTAECVIRHPGSVWDGVTRMDFYKAVMARVNG